MHKGNIMKFTEGAFRDWGYELAKAEFRDRIVTEEEVGQGAARDGKLLINDRIADSVFQQILTRTAEYDVFAAPNLNGDYLSDACARAGRRSGHGAGREHRRRDRVLRSDPRHGAEIRGEGRHQPSSVILSGVMMLNYLGWTEAGALIERGLEKTISQKKVTYDLARQMTGATELKTSEFADAIIKNM